MAHFLREKKLGLNNDFSAGLTPEQFEIDDVVRCGVNSRITCLAYDPVQSLLAVGTEDTKYGEGRVYIFGQNRVSLSYSFPRRASCTMLQFCYRSKLVHVTSRAELGVFSLEKKELEKVYSPPGQITALATDPALDFAFIGLQSGDVVTYDLDRLTPSPLKIPNLFRNEDPRTRYTSVVSLEFHPRDIGSLLIGYHVGAAIYSLKSDQSVKYMQYIVPAGAPGGDQKGSFPQMERFPPLVKAVWHPTGTFVLTVHNDNSLVFWDPKDIRIVLARTLTNSYIDQPGTAQGGDLPSAKEPISNVSWCCKQDPDDTGLLISGGQEVTGEKAITFWDLGPTPIYHTSSWQALAEHFANPKSERRIYTPPSSEVRSLTLIPRASPFFANAQDPLAIITLLSSGELLTLTFPSGYPITATNYLPISLSFVHPFAHKLALSHVNRSRWLGWTERRFSGPKILHGGSEVSRTVRKTDSRDIVQMAYSDGIIRLFDIGYADRIENPTVLQVDLARAVGRYDNILVSQMSLSGESGEFSVGLESGEMIIFKWGPNKQRDNPGPSADDKSSIASSAKNNRRGEVYEILDRTDPTLKQGFIPYLFLDQGKGAVTALKQSDIGFTCVGYKDGTLNVVDLRGARLALHAHLSEFNKPAKLALFRRRSVDPVVDWVTCIEFGILMLEDDEYSSIALFVGTARGNVLTFKILPDPAEGFKVSYVGVNNLHHKIIAIHPLNTDTGEPARASQATYGDLPKGILIKGVIVAVTTTDCRVFRPPNGRSSHKDWYGQVCHSAAVVRVPTAIPEALALVGVFSDGFVRTFTIPGLKEVNYGAISHVFDPSKYEEARISSEGSIVGWSGPAEIALLGLYAGGVVPKPQDTLFNPEIPMPARPTISNFQWISGTQYVTPKDLSMIIGGENRPPSKEMLEQSRRDEEEARAVARNQPSRSNTGSSTSYWDYMAKQMQEHTEKLGLAEQSVDRLEESSEGFAKDVENMLKRQKNKAALGAFSSKFGF